jgi:hypothetical protein
MVSLDSSDGFALNRLTQSILDSIDQNKRILGIARPDNRFNVEWGTFSLSGIQIFLVACR